MKKFNVCLAAIVGMACIPMSAPAAETKTAYCYPGGCSSPCVMRPYNRCGYGSCSSGPIYTSPSYSYYTTPSYTVPSYGGYGGSYSSPGMYQPSYGGGYAPMQGPAGYPLNPGYAPPAGPSPAAALGPAMGPSNFPMPPGMANPSAYPATYPGYGPYSQPGYAVPYGSRSNANMTSQANPNSPFYP